MINNSTQNSIEEAVSILNDGGIIIFPTDTAFGIGCSIDKKDSIRKLFEIRKRPLGQPTPVLVNSLEMAERYGDFSSNVIGELVAPNWPGALTIIVPTKDNIDPLLRKNGGIGLRVPDNQIALEIIKNSGVALLGPSANFHGESTPYAYEDLDPELTKLVDFVVPGETKLHAASTVISTLTDPWQIVRNGAVKITL